MYRQRSQAIESLQISNHSVKCQKCGMVVPIIGKLSKPNSNRIAVLEKRIKWLENYSRGNINRHYYINDVKQLKAELAELLEEDAKADKLRCLPLYSCRITGWKFVCSKCYDKIYHMHVMQTKPEIQKVYEIAYLSKVI
ncbi:MAG: hypothetical protein ACJ71C_06955 [Nitrososphaeraceae archaeon]